MRLWLPLLLLCASVSFAQYPLGPFSRLAKYPEGHVWNGFFGVQVERGFKLFALTPEPQANGTFGKTEYAGFISLEAEGQPLFQRLVQPGDGTRVAVCDATRLVVAKEAGGYRQSLELARGYPVGWLRAETPAADAGPTKWLLLGWDWAQKQPPDSCRLRLTGDAQPRTVALKSATEAVPAGQRLGHPLVLLHDAAGKFELALYLPYPEAQLTAQGDTLAVELPRHDGAPVPLAFALLPAGVDWQTAADLAPHAFTRPVAQDLRFATEDGKPSVTFTSQSEAVPNGWGLAARPTVALPPSLADRAPAGALKLPTLYGDVTLCPGTSQKIALPAVGRLEEIGPPATPLAPKWRARLAQLTAAQLGQLRPAGGFRSSEGRTFYDGLTCSGLMGAYPCLEPEQQQRVAEAVRRTLDLWWKGLRQDGETGIWYFPEPVPAVPVVDYPEITATILWPTVQYAALVDKEYARALAPKLAKLGPALAKAYDWNGAAYAYAGPEFLHLITESFIGGLVAWCAMNRLAEMNGDEAAAGEYAARAALAQESMKLLRWQDRYGTEGVVSEMRPDSLKTGVTNAWDYTMYTWFSYVPAFELPREDVYRVWTTLERTEWWQYSEKSKQRCYDYAHAMALARTFGPQAVAEKLPQFDDRPFGYDYFDATPSYLLMAYPWLAALGVK